MTKCMIDEAIKEVMKLVDWILTEGGMYLHIYGGSQSLYKEIAKKTFIYGIGSSLAKATKASWPPLLLIIGSYRMTQVKEAEELVKELKFFHFGKEKYRRNNNKKKVLSH